MRAGVWAGGRMDGRLRDSRDASADVRLILLVAQLVLLLVARFGAVLHREAVRQGLCMARE